VSRRRVPQKECQAGRPVYFQKEEEMRRLIEMGADVIMTDNPDVMYELLVEMGYYD
jgi:glycerophosphoryl diester phosphodiesterase